ncbi:hypothetical protein R1sor_000952 [Riccia sorocarpa]|uniref:Calcium permeable stress-gated cation channel 1 n=1 Tax=Riccia sorocarpa TaxID=122646 RepID=A0ABD3GXT9_9MARC
MTGASDVLTSFAINGILSVVLITLFSVFKNQPLNVRVYYSKWQLKGDKACPTKHIPTVSSNGIRRYLNLDAKSYIHVMDWIKECLKMPEAELIDHGGLDAAVFLRLISLGLQIFIPLTIFGFIVLVPLNVTDNQLAIDMATKTNFTYDALDTITISNIRLASDRLWAHLVAAYLYTAWVGWLLFKEYRSIAALRFSFLASQIARPDQFTILCRCIPEDPDESTAVHVDHFFRVNHPDHYLMNQVVYDANELAKMVKERAKLQNKVIYCEGLIDKKFSKARPTMKTGFWGLWGEQVDQLDYYSDKIVKLTEKINEERTRILSEETSVMPAAFISFDTRWGAAVCAQTVQSRDSSMWLTEWAPEPRDVYWANLPIPYHRLNSRKLGMRTLVVVLIIGFFFPISFVQGFANLASLERNVPFLTPIVQRGLLKSFIQGYLSGLILKVSLLVLPYILLIMTKFEGHVSYSRIEKSAAAKYFAFMVVNVFLGNVLVGTIFEQLKTFIESPTTIPQTFGNTVPMKATFFIAYTMVDGWTGCALMLIRLLPLLLFHFRSGLMVRTPRDLDRATPLGNLELNIALPHLGLYFLLGLVYACISPLILPFIVIYLGAAYVVHRNQIINCNEPKYESGAAYWPYMFGYIIVALLIKHITLIGLMTLKEAKSSTPFLLPLPICTIIFYFYCKNRFEHGFQFYALEEAMAKDTIERARNPNLDVRSFLENAYIHPSLRSVVAGNDEDDSDDGADELLNRNLPPKGGTKNLVSDGSLELQLESPKKSPAKTPPKTPPKTPTRPLSRGSSGGMDLEKTDDNSVSRRKALDVSESRRSLLDGSGMTDINSGDGKVAPHLESTSDTGSLSPGTRSLRQIPKSTV